MVNKYSCIDNHVLENMEYGVDCIEKKKKMNREKNETKNRNIWQNVAG